MRTAEKRKVTRTTRYLYTKGKMDSPSPVRVPSHSDSKQLRSFMQASRSTKGRPSVVPVKKKLQHVSEASVLQAASLPSTLTILAFLLPSSPLSCIRIFGGGAICAKSPGSLLPPTPWGLA